MARKKNEMKAKEPVKLRFKKLSNAILFLVMRLSDMLQREEVL